MRITVKIHRQLLRSVRADLSRPHPFAHERVGFILAAASATRDGLLLVAGTYVQVEDADYERNGRVGAQIGSDAMRKAIEAAYRPQRALLHVHSHGGTGVPRFSSVDLASGRQFVPAFANPMPRMPHCLLVLSDESAAGLCWTSADAQPLPITDFVAVGAPQTRTWSSV